MDSKPAFDVGRASRILHPIATRKIQEARDERAQFVYYTTANVAVSILEKHEVWMRNAATMNDYREIEYGLSCLDQARRTEAWGRFGRAIDSCHAGLFEEVVSRFDASRPGILRDTYITCVSRHHSSESAYGRLSMWRAYGGQDGVALVIDGAALLSEEDTLRAYTSPVEYFEPESFAQTMGNIALMIEDEQDFLASIPRDELKRMLFNVLLFSALCVKHPGFREEQEWRIFTLPTLYPDHALSEKIEIVRGTPQHVLKIPIGKKKNPSAQRDIGDVIRGIIHWSMCFPGNLGTGVPFATP